MAQTPHAPCAPTRTTKILMDLAKRRAASALESYFGSADDAAHVFSSLFSSHADDDDESSAELARPVNRMRAALESYFGSAEDSARAVSSMLRVPSEDSMHDQSSLLEAYFGSADDAASAVVGLSLIHI